MAFCSFTAGAAGGCGLSICALAATENSSIALATIIFTCFMIKIFLWDALNESFHKKKSPNLGTQQLVLVKYDYKIVRLLSADFYS